MRARVVRLTALILGILIAPAMCWQVYQLWPPGRWERYFIAAGSLGAYIFLSYGLGIEPAFLHAWDAPKPSASEDSAEL